MPTCVGKTKSTHRGVFIIRMRQIIPVLVGYSPPPPPLFFLLVFCGGMGGLLLGIDGRYIFREKKGVPQIILFQKLGVPSNHEFFRLWPSVTRFAPRTASTEKFGD